MVVCACRFEMNLPPREEAIHEEEAYSRASPRCDDRCWRCLTGRLTPGVPSRVCLTGRTHRLPRAECVSLCVDVPKPYLGESPSELAPLAVVFVS